MTLDKIRRVFCECVEKQTEQERNAYLDEVCHNDPSLRAEVEALLRAHGAQDDLLNGPILRSSMSPADPAISEGPGSRIGHYELLELIGEGGMGLVYRARQTEPIERTVALKIVKLGMDTLQVVARFRAEQQTLAMLDHPHIARVFDAGTTDSGRPYFVMEYVPGEPITAYCDHHKLSIEGRLELFAQACRAIQYAHQKGVLHRDLKPSNILVCQQDEGPILKIIDFGIAKAIAEPMGERTALTEQGQLLGTPEYMSPEQADLAYGRIDTRSDVYSLGVVLYELLAGAAPFAGNGLRNGGIEQIRQIIRGEEPKKPSAALTGLGQKAQEVAAMRRTQIFALAKRLKSELEWIPLKAIRKEPEQRYQSVSEMARDVSNYLRGDVLLAGPETAVYRTRKFVRKHAGSVATVALVAVTLIVSLLASTAMAFKAEEARTVAEEQNEEYRRLLYVHQVALADASYRDGNVKRAQELLEACPNDLRGWEWNRLNHISDQSTMTITGAAHQIASAIFSPDGRSIVSSGWGPTVKLWDAEDGTERKTLNGHGDAVCCVALSPDGRQIASGSKDKTVRLWDVETGSEVATLRGHTKDIWYVRFSPDGKRVASAELYDVIKIWDRASGKELLNIRKNTSDVDGGTHYVGGLAFSLDGRHIASGGNGEIRVWDANSGAEVLTIAAAHGNYVMNVAYSPDGKHLVSCGGDPSIRIWDATTGEETGSIRTRNRWLNCVNYDGAGKYIVSGSRDNTIDIWDAQTGENVMTLRGHRAPAESAAFSPDGSRILSSGDDKTIKLWDISNPPGQFSLQTPSLVTAISFSPDGRRLATPGTLWNATAGIELRRLTLFHDCAFSPDGKQMALAERHHMVRVWDTETGEQRTPFRGHNSHVFAVAYSPDGRNVAAASGKTIKIWDTATGAELMTLEDEKALGIWSLVYAPDGSRLVSYGRDNIIRVWDAGSGRRILAIEKEAGYLGNDPAISRDGKLIALGGKDSIPIWDATNGRELMTLRGHNARVVAVSFSPVADRLASCSHDDGTVRIWDTTTGLELMNLVGEGVYDVAFSPDGSTLAAACEGGIILWETKDPAGGAGARHKAQTVRQLVQRLRDEHGSYQDVMDHLSGDDTLDESVREMALRVVDCRIPAEAREVARNAMLTIAPFKRDIREYRTALAQLDKANRLLPDSVIILRALGAVQCRLGAYDDALESLAKCWQIQSDLGYKLDPLELSFRAMALHGAGQIEEAKAALVELRKQFDQTGRSWTGGRVVQALLPELEQLIEGTEP